MTEPVLLQSLEEGVLTLTLNRPDRRNALNDELQSALLSAVKGAATRDDVRALCITAAGDRMFCSGGDLQQMGGGEGFLAMHEGRFAFAELLLALWESPKPSLCKVAGHVMAGGVGLVLACDMAIAADHCTFSTPEMQRGFYPMMISTLMVRQLGRRRAQELILLGDRVSGAEAVQYGLVNRVVPAADLDARAAELARRLASHSPAAMRLGKRALAATSDMDLRSALGYLHGQLAINLMTEDAMEGISAFMEKRPPQWKGR